MYVRWTGWGVLALPLVVAGVFGGAVAAVAALPDLAEQSGSDIDHSGVPLGGIALGLMVAGGLAYLLGTALNRRRRPDGSWRWTDRHTLYDVPVQRFGRGCTVAGVFFLPLAAVGFVPAAAVWVLLIGWAALVITGLVLLRRHRRPAPKSSADSRARRAA